MKILDPHMDIQRFRQRMAQCAKCILILDYDGTLAPFRKERDQAVPYEGTTQILDRIISSTKSRVVIVTGRSIDDIIPLLGLKTLPEIWGVHGRERRTRDGKYDRKPVAREARECIDDICIWAGEAGLDDRFEKKSGSVALHIRGLEPDQAQRQIELIRKIWDGQARDNGLEPHIFNGGLEYRTKGCHKGQAVDTIMKEAGLRAVAAYLGDDLTDEDAFRAIRNYNGLGILVTKEFHPTEAKLWIRPPGELLYFLKQWEEICSGT